MYNDKTLIGVGCSHTFGAYGERYISENDPDAWICHERSWVKKLEKLGNFKSSINLAAPGGSNDRSLRVLLEYLENNNTDNLVVIFAITELSRLEFPKINHDLQGYETAKAGLWQTDPNTNSDQRYRAFMTQLYSEYYDHSFQQKIMRHRLIMLDAFLNSLNIEHYFINMLCKSEEIAEAKKNIPLLEFFVESFSGNVIDCVTHLNFKSDETNHFDHDANEYIAKYIHDKIIR